MRERNLFLAPPLFDLDMNYFNIASLMAHDPGLFFGALYRMIKSRRYSSIQERINGVAFSFDFNFDPVIRHMYARVYEYDVVKAMQSILRPGDTFIDVGANIGYLSAIGAGLVGTSGEVHSFEPVAEYFEKLKLLRDLNPDFRIVPNQMALGDHQGIAQINIGHCNIGWNTLVPDFMEDAVDQAPTNVIRLDNYIINNNLNTISLMKIDVEGFEFPVLRGLDEYLEDHHPALIVEVVPGAYPLLGADLAHLSNYMSKLGYKCVGLDHRAIDLVTLERSENVLFF
jgi:FkbM family methyltransferase